MGFMKQAFLVLTLLLTTQAVASTGVVLSRDYPDALSIRSMARRAVEDYTAQHAAFPDSIQLLQDLGYTAYHFPTSYRPQIDIRDSRLYLNSLGRPAFFGGQSAVLRKELSVNLPRPGLATNVEQTDPDGVSRQYQSWHFPGAKWLANGASGRQLEDAIRFDRLHTHICWLTDDYQGTFSAMPQSLGDLEKYFGTERNQLGWIGVSEVWSLEDVNRATGNLFVGWDSNRWVVSINNGIEVQTVSWRPMEGGKYRFDAPGLKY
jgi:hypothetical protein